MTYNVFSGTLNITQSIKHSHRLNLGSLGILSQHYSREHCFTDLTYSDDVAIFLPNEDQAASTLTALNESAASFDLKVFWAKTKL